MSVSTNRSLRAEASNSFNSSGGDAISLSCSKSPQSEGLLIDGNLINKDAAAASALSDYFRTSITEPISRPSSAASMRIRVDKPSSEAISGRALYTHVPTGFEEDPLLHPYHSSDDHYTLSSNSIRTNGKSHHSSSISSRRHVRDSVSSTFARRGGAPPYSRPTLYSRARLFVTQTTANVLSSFFLLLVIVWALSVRLLAAIPKFFAPSVKKQKEWDDPKRWGKEKLVKDVRYYAAACGFEIINETVETQDGYHLRMNRIIDPQTTHKKHSDGRGGFPVLIMHGLFQSSGSFVTSEERSLAFWLARHGGYQVFLGNNRGVFDMGHRTYKRSDPRFWDYNIRELAIYDLPAMIDWICKETGYDRIAFIGHSQGNGTMFISLSKGMVPELGNKLTYFGALAPAVYAGPLTSCFPFTTLGQLEWKEWKHANWLLRRKAKMFRFTPQPVSSASIYWWAGKDGFASRGCVLDPSLEQWWDENFPPLSIFSGGMDFLVLTDPLIERIRKREKTVKLLRFKRQDEAEHCDHFWAADAVEWCFRDILEDIERTRPRYPEEMVEMQGLNHNHKIGQNGNAVTKNFVDV
ncbi:related to YEH1 - steryl ester hydrolase [Melanopsichium pennsylvanicum]|uniref:Related to YEH1 - steryl ester hydrolase n=1 Tax=Melanopsichium pennsylvanicum TaxID=63383 RepID=A0AAJ4XRI8_9BASI|nr:related to YEH1 - steryl ester hydrolase [Melanopsichium pennsylvanicum]